MRTALLLTLSLAACAPEPIAIVDHDDPGVWVYNQSGETITDVAWTDGADTLAEGRDFSMAANVEIRLGIPDGASELHLDSDESSWVFTEFAPYVTVLPQ